MYKIVLLKSPGNLNVGNEFINVGAEYLVKKCLEQAHVKDYELFISEFWATNMTLHRHQTDWNTKEMKHWINSQDLIVVAAGSIVSPLMGAFLKDMQEFRPPVIILGAGMLTYTQEEQELAKRAFSKAKLVVCRDEILFQTINGSVLAVNGLDMAFFLDDAYVLPPAGGEYAVLNIDFSIRYMMQREKKYRELKKRFETVYLTENTSAMHQKKDFVFLSRWSEFCNLYANAAFVCTTRIHTCVVCTVFQTPFEYIGNDCEPNAKRSALFRQIGMPLEKNKIYDQKQLQEVQVNIQAKKREVEKKVVEMLREVLS